jgi:hypothetical protein
MPKAKKIGRPKLPKGHAKGKIVPVRLNDREVKHFMNAASAHDQTLSQWVREGLRLWDDRLDEQGIDAVIWQGANQGDPRQKKLTVIFKEMQGDRRVTINQDMFANAEQNEYAPLPVEEELQKRGVEDVRVTTTLKPYVRSTIHFKLKGVREPVVIMKRY